LDGDPAHCQLLALEIDHGTFERALDLPHPVKSDDVAMEYRDGFLRITLSQRT
jgi:HSP20 family molecular chaperone IbpA